LVACRATRALCARPAARTAIGIRGPGPTYAVARGSGTAAAFAVSCCASVGFTPASCSVEGRSCAACVVDAPCIGPRAAYRSADRAHALVAGRVQFPTPATRVHTPGGVTSARGAEHLIITRATGYARAINDLLPRRTLALAAVVIERLTRGGAAVVDAPIAADRRGGRRTFTLAISPNLPRHGAARSSWLSVVPRGGESHSRRRGNEHATKQGGCQHAQRLAPRDGAVGKSARRAVEGGCPGMILSGAFDPRTVLFYRHRADPSVVLTRCSFLLVTCISPPNKSRRLSVSAPLLNQLRHWLHPPQAPKSGDRFLRPYLAPSTSTKFL